ncbi:MAG TPA: ACP S-malonyltransferase [Casimicrobiaceae bacterium]|nr:ACP S-malonyltransferase [Casimicrobiaceae bacterium]
MKLAFVFPGQGSQQVGMMKNFTDFPEVRATFDEASAALGDDLWALAEDGPADALNLTRNTQPVMLTADIALWRAWLGAGGAKPAIVAGHSLGEYAALVAAGALALADAVPLVRFRAETMQDAVPQGVGAMAAIIGGEDAAIAEACREAAQGEVVEPVNFNAPGQLVIAGHKTAVERAIATAKAKGAKRGLLLPVSAPFHSSLLKPAAEKLAQRLAQVPVTTPTLTVLHNADVASHATPDAVRAALARQAASAVRWSDTIRAFAAQGVTHIVECGPGKVLAGLVRRIDATLTVYSLGDRPEFDEALPLARGSSDGR